METKSALVIVEEITQIVLPILAHFKEVEVVVVNVPKCETATITLGATDPIRGYRNWVNNVMTFGTEEYVTNRVYLTKGPFAPYVGKALDYKANIPEHNMVWEMHGRNAVLGDFRIEG